MVEVVVVTARGAANIVSGSKKKTLNDEEKSIIMNYTVVCWGLGYG